MSENKRILVCPLDWGLGHATRSIVIIHEFIKQGATVGIASSGSSQLLLQKEFPALKHYSLTGYKPFYSGSGSLIGSMIRQLPKFLRTIGREHDEIEKIVASDGWDIVVSDNRYGCWSGHVPSILVTHQLNIQAPALFRWTINFLNHRAIKKFSKCWVPDSPGSEALAGKLSESNGFAVSYIGLLSRFQNSIGLDRKYDIIAIISGPEPQREIFERLARIQLGLINRPALLVRGLPGKSEFTKEGNLEVVDCLSSSELNDAILRSDLVVSRPGYSTIMDLARLGKKAIFIPTPGQTEQTYLASKLMLEGIAFSMDQNNFDLANAIDQTIDYKGFEQHGEDVLLNREVKALLQ